MPEHPQFIPSSSLRRYTEATRRALYDATVAVHFPPAGLADAEECAPSYSPDDAGLTILYVGDRWLALWEMVEERDNPELPPDRKRELLRIAADPSLPFGIAFSEV